MSSQFPNFAFQPTLPARGATVPIPLDMADDIISTHAPRTGSDTTSSAVVSMSE